MASTTSASSPVKWRPASITPVNSASAWRTLAPSRPVSAIASSHAEKNEMPSSAASSRILAMEVVPMPRRGVLTTRSAATSSSGFTTSLRYAMTSRTSARSKKRVPPTIL